MRLKNRTIMFYSTKNIYIEAKKTLRGIRTIEILESDVKVNGLM